jgi:hypothetical protein
VILAKEGPINLGPVWTVEGVLAGRKRRAKNKSNEKIHNSFSVK